MEIFLNYNVCVSSRKTRTLDTFLELIIDFFLNNFCVSVIGFV
jgi:hypothetical protein